MNPRKRKDFAAKYKENICVLCIKYDLIMSHLRTQKNSLCTCGASGAGVPPWAWCPTASFKD